MNSGASIRVISECFIKPNSSVLEDASRRTFYLGSFELTLMSRFYFQNGLLFRKLPTQSDDGNIKSEYLETLKQSFKTTLDHFYPLAGQFVRAVEEDIHKSFIYVDCNKGPGANFIHATLHDVKIDDIAHPTYVPSIVQSFFDLGQIPRNSDAFNVPIIVVQVTELVDGVFLGVSVNHCVVDGATFWHFLSSWSEIFQSDNDTMVISRPPICERWFPEGHGPILKIPNIHLDELIVKSSVERNETLREVIFHLSSESIEALKAKANAECGMVDKISSFQALSAAIWRFIVRARRQHHYYEDSICAIPVNARPRIVPPLSEDYLGCCAVVFLNRYKVSELVESSLGKVALSLHQKEQEMTFDHLRDRFVGWAKSPYFSPVGMRSPNSVLITGIPREDVYNVDFGYGKAITVLSGSIKHDGKVVIHAGREGRGSVNAQVCLSIDAMIALQHDREFVSLLS